jgi:hypothetical protein
MNRGKNKARTLLTKRGETLWMLSLIKQSTERMILAPSATTDTTDRKYLTVLPHSKLKLDASNIN